MSDFSKRIWPTIIIKTRASTEFHNSLPIEQRKLLAVSELQIRIQERLFRYEALLFELRKLEKEINRLVKELPEPPESGDE